MSTLNKSVRSTIVTHEGGKAVPINAEKQLRRSVLACLLWEDSFYEDGQSIADRIISAAKAVPATTLAVLAVEARTDHHLRHVPLLLTSVLADTNKGNSLVADTVHAVVQRADELSELLAVYCQYKGVGPDQIKSVMTHGLRKGLARAFTKFSPYQLAKYNRDKAIKLRDVLFLSHTKPHNDAMAKLIDGTLEAPDTWEVSLSAGKDKKETWERLIKEEKLGYLALLRNLRNMSLAGADFGLVESAILARKGGADKVLPFRYVAAARYAPMYEPALDKSLCETINSLPKLRGKTIILVDVSGSMDAPLSAKSDMKRIDAAAALASVVNSEHLRVFTFSRHLQEVAPRRGMAGVDTIVRSQPHNSTELGQALKETNHIERDRLIVITDEQSSDRVLAPDGNKYLINVDTYQNGVGYRDGWNHIDGFSENVIKYIIESER